MLDKLTRSRSLYGFETPVRTGAAIVAGVVLCYVAGASQPAYAAVVQADHAPGERAKWIKICKADIWRFCDEANLKQECLIAHWSKISAECQVVLGTSAGNRPGDGS